MFGFPTTAEGWLNYLVTIGIPIMIILAIYPRVFGVADNIYDGRNGS